MKKKDEDRVEIAMDHLCRALELSESKAVPKAQRKELYRARGVLNVAIKNTWGKRNGR